MKQRSAGFADMRALAVRFRDLLRSGNIALLDTWLSHTAISGLPAMRQFAATLRRDLDAVRNVIVERQSNGHTEEQINWLKTLKHAMYGRVGTELLCTRMLPLQSNGDHTT